MSNNRHDKQRQRSKSNHQTKVYVGNVPTDQLSDQDLLDFFKPFGKILDIRVYKRYLFVQFENVDQANELIRKGQQSLTIKGHQLDVLPSMDVSLRENHQYSSQHFLSDQICQKKDDLSKSNDSDDQSLVYEPPRKRFFNEKCSDLSKESNEFVDCRILLVSQRQKSYAEEISSHLKRKHLTTSIEILDRDHSFDEAIQHAKQDHCLYAIILTPFHQNQNLVSFHILHQQHKEYRNVKLEDCYEIILEHYSTYKSKETYFNSDRFPLPMLLCLLADGKQLNSNEIDRVITYLIQKKQNLVN